MIPAEQAVSVVKRGAFHAVSKGDDLDDLLLHVRKALEAGQLRRRVHLFRTQPGTPGRGLDTIVGGGGGGGIPDDDILSIEEIADDIGEGVGAVGEGVGNAAGAVADVADKAPARGHALFRKLWGG